MEIQRSTAGWKLVLVRRSQLVLAELVVVQAPAVLVERRAKRTEMFGYFMTDVMGMGWGVVVSYLLNWAVMHGGMNHLFDSKLIGRKDDASRSSTGIY